MEELEAEQKFEILDWGKEEWEGKKRKKEE